MFAGPSIRLVQAAVHSQLRDRDRCTQVDILNGMKQRNSFRHRLLESLAPTDHAAAARTFVDHGCGDSFSQIVVARRSARVDQTAATHVASSDLQAGHVDRMLGQQVAVDLGVSLAELDGAEAILVRLGQLLLDDVGFDGDAEVVGLGRQISRHVVVLVALLEAVVTQVAPEYGGHPELMRALEGFGHLDDLARRFLGTEVDRGADRDCTHLPGLLDAAEHDLVVLGGIGEELVVIELDDKGNLVRILARYRTERPEGGNHGVAAAGDGELDDVLRVEVDRIGGKRSAGRVLDTLVDRQNGEVTGAGQPARVEELLQTAHHLR